MWMLGYHRFIALSVRLRTVTIISTVDMELTQLI